MDENEIFISGIGISRDVIAQIATAAAEKVEGVVRVGSNDITSSLISVFTRRSQPQERAVETEVVDDKLVITIHLAVFFGYVFTQVAADVRKAVDRAVSEQIGIECGAVNICIDGLVFPKE
ncbi:MAG: Asp23/Gls24 family envelope stress response protein [Atopobiaceae bacterium]|nr:Asp23/Gls24 family envelope stress response protein [Atopobiaceae bacterium]